MKLIRCKECNDVVRLIAKKWRMCDCGKSGGQYNADLMSATVAGNCDIVGISNLFFDDKFRALTEENKVIFRKENNHHWCEIWYGEMEGDEQILRIKNPKGPRLKMDIVVLSKKRVKAIITDKRKYSINRKHNNMPKFIITENNLQPSFKNIKKKTKKS